MPLTNAPERRSAVALSYHYYGPGVTPDATPGIEWRQQSGHGYSGIAVGAATAAAVGAVYVFQWIWSGFDLDHRKS